MTQGNALQNGQHIYQLSRLNIQRCITYTYVHVCGYLFSTVVCYGYVCLFVYTCKSACSCVYLAVLTYCLAICMFTMWWFFSYMYTYWINDFWFLISLFYFICRCINRDSTFTCCIYQYFPAFLDWHWAMLSYMLYLPIFSGIASLALGLRNHDDVIK